MIRNNTVYHLHASEETNVISNVNTVATLLKLVDIPEITVNSTDCMTKILKIIVPIYLLTETL